MTNQFRQEKDSIGILKVPKEALYGANALRAEQNFKITGNKMDKQFIKALVEVKKTCALVNNEVGHLDDKRTKFIVEACDKLLKGENLDQIICDPIQGGAGTSFNMNINEILANMSNLALGGQLGVYDKVHPNDHVNKGQSTNDTIPTSGKIAMIRYFKQLKDENLKLKESFEKKAEEFDEYIKMGRTHLQDAIPIRLGQEFKAYAAPLKRGERRFDLAIEALSYVNLGGTAIGTGLNANQNYFDKIVPKLSEITGLDLKQVDDLIEGTQNLDCFAYASSILKVYALSLSKICNDLRLLSSGPKTGIGDIVLPSMQAGSSIMPGKVNPVIPEVVNQVAFLVAGNDLTISMAVEAGQLELNVFEPVLFYKMFESLKALRGAINSLRINCIEGIRADQEKLREEVESSIGIITALAPHIGYEKSASVAKEALKTGQSIKKIIIDKKIMPMNDLERVLDYYKMTSPGVVADDLLKEQF